MSKKNKEKIKIDKNPETFRWIDFFYIYGVKNIHIIDFHWSDESSHKEIRLLS